MTEISLKQTFNGTYPHLAWTIEEEEAFNLISATEYPPPTLMGRFKKASTAAMEKIIRAFEATPYHFHS